MGECELCGRIVPVLTAHHLVPKLESRRRGEQPGATADLCSACHRQIHAHFTHRQLATTFNTVDALRNAPGMPDFIAWVRRQDPAKRIRISKPR